MKKEIMKLHLHMFDGAGGDGGAASAGSEGSAAAASEGQSRVEYGKAPSGAQQVQVGSEQNNGGSQQNTPAAENPAAEFDELIKGKYKEQYSQRVQETIQNRFKNNQDFQKKAEGYEEATAILFQRYGLKPGDVEGLKNAINHDEGMFSAAAEEEGLTVAKYMEMQRQQAEAERAKSMLAQMQNEQAKQERYAQWEADEAELQQQFPSFSLAQEMQNADFAQRLDSGYSVRDAFLTAHMGEILSGSFDMARQQAQSQMVSAINARQARPAENALHQAPTTQRKVDPSKWTDKDFDEVEKRVMRGEKIYL